MSLIRGNMSVRRNDKCPCDSGKKYKHCHSPEASKHPNSHMKPVKYIDNGEEAVKYVIGDSTGVKFFSDKDNNILVFASREDATAIALLEDFAEQSPGEINVAGVGQTKWEHLQTKLPYVEVKSVEHAASLIRERIEIQAAKLESMSDEVDQPEKENCSEEKAQPETASEENEINAQ
jgi:hypothetical protein